MQSAEGETDEALLARLLYSWTLESLHQGQHVTLPTVPTALLHFDDDHSAAFIFGSYYVGVAKAKFLQVFKCLPQSCPKCYYCRSEDYDRGVHQRLLRDQQTECRANFRPSPATGRLFQCQDIRTFVPRWSRTRAISVRATLTWVANWIGVAEEDEYPSEAKFVMASWPLIKLRTASESSVQVFVEIRQVRAYILGVFTIRNNL